MQIKDDTTSLLDSLTQFIQNEQHIQKSKEYN